MFAISRKLVLMVFYGGLCMPVANAATTFEADYVWVDRFQQTLTQAADGNAKVQYELARMYESGHGTHKDLGQSFQWYQRAAQQNHPKAQYRLGYMYLHGTGVEQDHKKALSYLSLSAAKGYVRAQFYLGRMYERGKGTSTDLGKALLWYSRASIGGYLPAEDAMENIDNMLDALEKQQQAGARENTPTPLPGSKNIVKKVAVVKPLTMVDGLLQGSWYKRAAPAEVLPSSITTCRKQTGAIIICLSEKRKRTISAAEVTYHSKTMLFDIQQDGSFQVVYRNNVMEIIEPEDDDEFRQEPINIKLGWQETEHHLVCNMEEKTKNVSCIQDKIRKIRFSQAQPPILSVLK